MNSSLIEDSSNAIQAAIDIQKVLQVYNQERIAAKDWSGVEEMVMK